jgi:quinol monooxygenase YgiN
LEREAGMIRMNIVLTVKDDGDIDLVRSLLAEHGRLSRQEPGCRRFEVNHSQTDPKVFILCEWWESQQAIDVHRTAQGYKEIYQPKVLPLIDRVAHVSTLVE